MGSPTGPTLDHQQEFGDTKIPSIVLELAGESQIEFVWRNELGGLTFRFDDQFVKWSPHVGGLDLEDERVRLEWVSKLHRGPQVIDSGSDNDGQWLRTRALWGESAVSTQWRSRPREAIRSIAEGLRVLHTIPVLDVPPSWTEQSWANRCPTSLGQRPEILEPVLVHGDACAPNTIIAASGEWAGHVDFGAMTVGDRWADLAVASMSLDWNYGEGHQAEFFEAYGVEPDDERIRYYRALWNLES